MVLLDGARWDRVEQVESFKELKKEGYFLNNVTTSAPYTFASMNTIFTGLHGKENGVDAYYKMFRLKNSVEFLPEILQKNGYFTACDLITEKVVANRGFDIYQSHDEYKDDLKTKHTEMIKNCLEKGNGNPFFVFLQYSAIHKATVSEILKKYEWNDKEFYENIDDNLKKYDNAFLETANYAKVIHKSIEDLGIKDDTLIIFFTDHGTGIGERFGERNYGVFLYEETLRTIYLIIGNNIKKEKSSKLFATVDILPTILDLLGINLKLKSTGKSLAAMLRGKETIEEDDYTFAATGGLQGPFPSPKEPNVFCVKTKERKLIYFKSNNNWELYDLVNDPLEKLNIFGKNDFAEEKLKNILQNWIQR